MGVVIFLLVGILIVAFLIFLPAISGVGKFGVENRKKDSQDDEVIEKAQFSGYVPPDEFEVKTKSKREKFKEKVENLNIPLSFKANGLEETEHELRKRKVGSRTTSPLASPDPNEFDYDIDELISDDRLLEEEEHREQVKKYSKPVSVFNV